MHAQLTLDSIFTAFSNTSQDDMKKRELARELAREHHRANEQRLQQEHDITVKRMDSEIIALEQRIKILSSESLRVQDRY